MNADLIKLLFTYAIATIVVVGGGLMLFISRTDATTDFALLVAGFIGSAITFVFGHESATQASRASDRANAAGATAALSVPPTLSPTPPPEP